MATIGRSKEELIKRMSFHRFQAMDAPALADQEELVFYSSIWALNAVKRTCQERRTIRTRESQESLCSMCVLRLSLSNADIWLYNRAFSIMVKVFTNGPEDRGPILLGVIRKSQKCSFISPCFILSIVMNGSKVSWAIQGKK